ncbi:Tyrosyl-DNA phosphodiesterase I [Parasponia andersonii]|uniref:Tyrosyl-DNA phosphodiesterase I n=1 Tax=Parasponia andersonii TaxID=3476 RepID=A0A2P5ASA7_PARAD|nr:Tyrosyl-DNA phosphodiesterase I [Parasponia andersonii]
MAQPKIGYLISLNEMLEEDPSVPQIPVFRGLNFIGRNSVSVPEKRLSRKHLTLTASPNGSANLVVEGTNPVVINSGNIRKKLYSRENGSISSGDVIELIPGHYFFKYVTLSGSDDGREAGEGDALGRKRLRQTSEANVSERNSKILELEKKGRVEASNLMSGNAGSSLSKRDSNEEAIGHFCVSDDKLPLTFRLLSVRGLPQWANTFCVSIKDVIQGNILFAVLSNYMVDIDWLLAACPLLAKIPQVLVVHGEGDGTLDHMKRNKPASWVLHKPPLPISFGTHHSKAMLLVYPQGVRIIIHTANLIYVDWNNKSQGLWMQDFPWKERNKPSKGCAFENDLIDYLTALKWPEFSLNLPTLGSFTINSSFFKKFDYRDAEVRLIASVPGYHTGVNLKKWGHMKLRDVLQECTFDPEFQKSPLVYQFSSLGSLDEKWMAELASSMSSGLSEDKTPLGPGEPLIIWPTVEDVRCSLEGYAAGNAIPSPLKNVEKAFLKKYWAKWKASHTGRCRAMPHIKTFARYNGQKLAWFLLTSANLSKAAWGALQRNNSQLMIRSYELGVLFLPFKRCSSGFSCTTTGNTAQVNCESSKNSIPQKAELVTLNWQRSTNTVSSYDEVIKLPVPYELPPQPYSSEDVPWSWDRRYNKKDVYGQVWPRHVQLYSNQDS